MSAIAVNLLKQCTKGLLKDEPLFVFSIHAGGGMVGMFLTGCFAEYVPRSLYSWNVLTQRFVVLQLSDWTDTQQYQIVLLLEDFGKLLEIVSWNVTLTCCRYQMLDAFAGFFYTLFTTLAILFGLKGVRSIFKRQWWAPVFTTETNANRRWKLEATPQHSWKQMS